MELACWISSSDPFPNIIGRNHCCTEGEGAPGTEMEITVIVITLLLPNSGKNSSQKSAGLHPVVFFKHHQIAHCPLPSISILGLISSRHAEPSPTTPSWPRSDCPRSIENVLPACNGQLNLRAAYTWNRNQVSSTLLHNHRTIILIEIHRSSISLRQPSPHQRSMV